MKKDLNKPTAKNIADKMTKKTLRKTSKESSKKSAKITVEDDAILAKQLTKLENIIKEVTNSTTVDSEMLRALKEVQEKAGTKESQKILDKLLALNKAKKENKLDEFLMKEFQEKRKRTKSQQELTGLTNKQKRSIHDFMKNSINCDEYIVIALTEYENGLQTEVLTQLRGEVVEGVLSQIVKSIRNDEGIQEDIEIKD